MARVKLEGVKKVSPFFIFDQPIQRRLIQIRAEEEEEEEEKKKSQKEEEQRGNSGDETNTSPSVRDSSQTAGWLFFIRVERGGSRDLRGQQGSVRVTPPPTPTPTRLGG